MADGRNYTRYRVRPTDPNQPYVSRKPVPVQGKHLNFVSTILYSQLCRMALHDGRGCGQARNGDGLQRSLRLKNVLADDEQWVR